MERQRGKNTRRRSNSGKPPQEFEQKVLDIARVARVVAGGRRFSFRTVVVIGDKKGRVGVGVGKGGDVSISIGKAARKARKNLISAPMTKDGTLPYDITGKQSGSVVLLKPIKKGKGIIAGGAVRAICGLAGYQDIGAKVLSRSTNKLNIALATINALESIDYIKPAQETNKTEEKSADKKYSEKKKTKKKDEKAS